LISSIQIGRNAKLLETLTNNNWPPEVDPGGHSFVILNVSINNTPVFVSAVVNYKKIADTKIEGEDGLIDSHL